MKSAAISTIILAIFVVTSSVQTQPTDQTKIQQPHISILQPSRAPKRDRQPQQDSVDEQPISKVPRYMVQYPQHVQQPALLPNQLPLLPPAQQSPLPPAQHPTMHSDQPQNLLSNCK